MKKWILLLLALALLPCLTACSLSLKSESGATLPPMPKPDSDAFQFTPENFPVLDGSTSMVPLGQGIASALLGESREDAAARINFNRTTQSFRNLRDGACDVVIAAEPNASVFTEMEESLFRYEMETIAKEALVFVVNSKNPVDSLTWEQVKGIYSGEITNWKEVGGRNAPIQAFQRNASSGSQVMMEKLVMGKTPMMEAPDTQIPGEMGELIQSVKNYDNAANAIGYTVYYYAADMQMAQGLKILKIDGVLPEPQTLQDETYPFVNGYYCCISAKAKADSPARQLYNWLVSEAGQTLLRLEGYVPVYAAGQAPHSGSDVAADYSHYAPNGGTPAKYTAPGGRIPDALASGTDYGRIFPYVGGLQYSAFDPEENPKEEYLSGRTYGFYTETGRILSKPVYCTVIQKALGEDYFWIFGISDEEGRISWGLAAPDGHTVSNAEYAYIQPMGTYICCSRSNGTFDLYDSECNFYRKNTDFQVSGRPVEPQDQTGELFICTARNDDETETYYAINEANEVVYGPAGYICCYPDGTVCLKDENQCMTVLSPEGETVCFDGHPWVRSYYPLNDQFCAVTLPDNTSVITDRNGNLFEWGFRYDISYANHAFSVQFKDGSRYYMADGTAVYPNKVPSEWIWTGVGSLFCREIDGGMLFREMNSGNEKWIEKCNYAYGLFESEDYPIDLIVLNFYDSATQSHRYRLMNSRMELLEQEFSNYRTLRDLSTGEYGLVVTDSYGFSGEQRLLSPDGQTELFRANGEIDVQCGNRTVVSDWAFTVYTESGDVLFCYPFFGFASGD